MKNFYVMLWDSNTDELVAYDVLPYFRSRYDDTEKNKRPKTFEEWEAYVERWGLYRYWGQCQYEFLVRAWPPVPEKDKDGNINKRYREYKVDVWQQLKPNVGIVAEILMKEYETEIH